MLRAWLLGVALLASAWAMHRPRELKPGLNLFSKQQDIRLGNELSGQVARQMRLVSSLEANTYISRIGRQLASQPEADQFPYRFHIVADRRINAFSLPGGPVYVNTGLIRAVENEAQLAGVLAHEIAHVALRHATNQVSKAELIRLPAMIGGAMVGGSIAGELAQLGIGLGANSVLLKFSRNAERDADLLGVRVMSRSGYNPIEMAHFFEMLQARGDGRAVEFLSDHPSPGNRVKAVEEELRYLPVRRYRPDTGELPRIKALVAETR